MRCFSTGFQGQKVKDFHNARVYQYASILVIDSRNVNGTEQPAHQDARGMIALVAMLTQEMYWRWRSIQQTTSTSRIMVVRDALSSSIFGPRMPSSKCVAAHARSIVMENRTHHLKGKIKPPNDLHVKTR